MLFCIVASASVTNFFPTVVATLGYGKIDSLLLTAPPYVRKRSCCAVYNLRYLGSLRHYSFLQCVARGQNRGAILPHHASSLFCIRCFHYRGSYHRYHSQVFRNDDHGTWSVHWLRSSLSMDLEHLTSAASEASSSSGGD